MAFFLLTLEQNLKKMVPFLYRRLCDMDADEFMMHDFNSEDEEDENSKTSESFESEITHVPQERHK